MTGTAALNGSGRDGEIVGSFLSDYREFMRDYREYFEKVKRYYKARVKMFQGYLEFERF